MKRTFGRSVTGVLPEENPVAFFLPLIPTLPDTAPFGQIYFQTSDNSLYFGDGTNWIKPAQNPINGATDIENGTVTDIKLESTPTSDNTANTIMRRDANTATNIGTLIISPPGANGVNQLLLKDGFTGSNTYLYSGASTSGWTINDNTSGFSFDQITSAYTLTASSGSLPGSTFSGAIVLPNSSSSTTNNALWSDGGILTLYSTLGTGGAIGKTRYFACRRAYVTGTTGNVSTNYGISNATHSATGKYDFTITSSGSVPSVSAIGGNITGGVITCVVTALTDTTVSIWVYVAGVLTDNDFLLTLMG